MSGVLSCGLYKYFNYAGKKGFFEGFVFSLLYLFLKRFNPECFMGYVIQRLYDFMGFILLNMRENVFERMSSRM
jgi:hypothetical protein